MISSTYAPMRNHLEGIREMLNLKEADDARLMPLLTTESAPKTEKWNGPTVRIRYFGHACVLVEYNADDHFY